MGYGLIDPLAALSSAHASMESPSEGLPFHDDPQPQSSWLFATLAILVLTVGGITGVVAWTRRHSALD